MLVLYKFHYYYYYYYYNKVQLKPKLFFTDRNANLTLDSDAINFIHLMHAI